MELAGTVRVDAGQLTRLRLAPPRGIEVELVARLPRALEPNETLHLVLRTPRGREELRVPPALRREPGSIALALVLPQDAEALTLSTSRGLAGELSTLADSLSGARPTLQLDLATK